MGAAGGSGVCYLSIPAMYYTGNVTGSYSVVDNGNYKVIIFTGNGTYTA